MTQRSAEEVGDDDECPDCGDSGYIETSSGGHWTGENIRVTQTICHCLCGDDVRREIGIPPTPPAEDEQP